MLRAGDRPVVRRDQVLYGPSKRRDERGRDVVLAGRDGDRLGAQVHAVGIGRCSSSGRRRAARRARRRSRSRLLGRLGGVQRGAAVAVQRAGGLVVERHAEAVLAVGRERVHRPTGRRACRTARPRRARAATSSATPGRWLRAPSRSRSPTASRLISAAAFRYDLHQRRRQQLRVGDVVEVGALGVERQVVAGVDVEAEQVADDARVLGAVEALEGAAAGRGLAGARRRPAPRARRPAPSSAASSGRRLPAGGIRPARSLRIIFSVTSSVLAGLRDRRSRASDSPPALARSLWQPTQVWVTVCCAAAMDAVDASAGAWMARDAGGAWRAVTAAPTSPGERGSN